MICKGCKNHAFRIVTRPPIHFTSWGCLLHKVKFGRNKDAGQIERPKTCKDKG